MDENNTNTTNTANADVTTSKNAQVLAPQDR